MDSARIVAIDAQARKGFTWKADPADFDNWRDHSEDVHAARSWVGDCDDLTATVLRMLSDEGMPDDKLFRIRCLTSVGAAAGDKADHMIGAAIDDNGHVWIVADCNMDTAVPAAACPYQPYDYQRLDEWIDRWTPQMRDGFPWQAVKA